MSLTQLNRNVKPYSIKLTPQERQKEQCIQELTQWLQDYDWGYFLTLTFKYPVYDSFRVSQAIERFINHLSGKAFGKRSAKRIQAFPVIEKGSDDALHVHMMIQDPKERINPLRQQRFHLRDAIIEAWLQASSSAGHPALASKDDEWMKLIDNVSGVIGYLSKQLMLTPDTHHSPIAYEHVCLNGRKQCA